MSMLLLAFLVPLSTSSLPVRSPAQIIPPSFHIPYDDSVSSFATSVSVANPNNKPRETELSTTGAVATSQSAIDRYLQETAAKYTFKSIKPADASTSPSSSMLPTASSYVSSQFPHHSSPAATPAALESTTSAVAPKQYIDNRFQQSTAAKHTFNSIKPTAPFTSSTTTPPVSTPSYASPLVPHGSYARESPAPPAALQSTTRATTIKHWIDSRFAQSAPKHTFKSIKATAAPLHPTALTNSRIVPRVAYDSSARSSDCLCAYADAADMDEKITMDKGPYFYLFVNGLPPNEQRRKRACGLCSGGNQLVRQRDAVQRNDYGTSNRNSRDSVEPRNVPYQYTPPLGIASYLAPYMRRPSPITPLVPA